jgi:hypothetical protein
MNSRRRMGWIRDAPRGMWKYYQTSPPKCVTKVTYARAMVGTARAARGQAWRLAFSTN